LHKTGHAVGLRVDLPDLTDKGETAALCRLPSDTWKDPFEGEVSDTMRNGGHNWLRLADYPFATAFFDLEEGIKFRTAVAEDLDALGAKPVQKAGERQARAVEVGHRDPQTC